MGSFANSLFTILLGWLQGAVSAVWSAFTTEDGGLLFTWIGRHWILIAGILCLVGMAADLCVYLFRWKPFQVWKNFLSRGRHRESMTEEDARENNRPAFSRTEPALQRDAGAGRVRGNRPEEKEPDLSCWETEEDTAVSRPGQHADHPATVTHAGYVVPADSPYRRPETKERSISGPEPDKTQDRAYPDAAEDRENTTVMRTGKRRRISVSELFADPEEELKVYDAPQQIIDRRKAYHDPVYPRGWKNSEDSKG